MGDDAGFGQALPPQFTLANDSVRGTKPNVFIASIHWRGIALFVFPVVTTANYTLICGFRDGLETR